MKKILIAILIILALFSFAACQKDDIILNFYDGEELIQSISWDKETFPEITPPEKKGHTFEGWYIDKNLTQKFKTSDLKNGLNLYAKYIRNTYTVTFKAEGFEDITRKVAFGDALKDIPAVPAKQGYDGKWEDVGLSSITSDITVNAIYSIKELTIVFKAEGFQDIIRKVKYNQTLEDIPSVPQKEGKSAHWDIENFENITQDLIVNAVYTDIMKKVSFISKIEKPVEQIFIETVEVVYDTDLSPSLIPEPYPFEGYYVIGWEDKDLTKIKNDIEVYAIYQPFTYDITFFDWDNNIIITLEDVEYGSILKDIIENSQDLDPAIIEELLNPQIPEELQNEMNHNFRYGNKLYDADIYTPITRGGSYFLIFDTTIKITVFANGGELEGDFDIIDGEEKEVQAGTSLVDLDIKERYGYKFLGWYTSSDYAPEYFDPENLPQDLIEINKNIPLYQNTMLIALWEKLFCQISFPDIDGVGFYIDNEPHSGIITIDYGESIDFLIDTQKDILRVLANDLELTADNGLYALGQIEENIVIAIETSEIPIHTLRFYSQDQILLHTLYVNNGRILLLIPEIESIHGASGEWRCIEHPSFSFDSPITEDLTFELSYSYFTYPIYYHYDGLIKAENIDYGDISYILWSPPPKEGYLFEGWYVNEQLSQKASVQYAVNMGRPVNLYAKWTEEKDFEHPIIGKWYAERMILHFYQNGLVTFNFEEKFFEYSYTVIDEAVFILDEELIFEHGQLIYKNTVFTKTDQNVTIIEFGSLGLYTIVGDRIPYNDEVFSYYWYLDDNIYKEMYDIYGELDYDKVENNFLRLYPHPFRLVKIYYDAMDGVTQYNIEYQYVYVTQYYELIFSDPDDTLTDFIFATKDHHIFVGWTVEDTSILMDKNYLTNNYILEIRAKAKYISDAITPPENTIEGFYYHYDSQSESITTVEFYADGTYQITKMNIYHRGDRYILFYYFWDENGFRDENGNEIAVQDSVISLYIDGVLISLKKPVYNVIFPYFAYPKEDNDYDFIEIYEDYVLYNNQIVDAVIENNFLFYIQRYPDDLCHLITIDMDDLIALNQDIPQHYNGVFEGQHIFEVPEGENLIVDIQVTISANHTALLMYKSENYPDWEYEAKVFYYQEQCHILYKIYDTLQKVYFYYDEIEGIYILDVYPAIVQMQKIQ
ncbi:MAG TPA: InlB B-repeat-containing protein [Clostridiales bacterium]|jgi:uncharacterized repeat protein (TIGR02543 family)|nr:InlB B-repeat-containing protein [Clostridiales bacterium]